MLQTFSEGELLQKVLSERYFSKISDIEVDGEKVEPPKNLDWYYTPYFYK